MLILHKQVKAQQDLKKIWLYSFKNHGERQADKYYDELIVGISAIQENPSIGVCCDYIRPGYRQHKINQHFVFYRVSATTIHVVRVLHERMKFDKHI